MFDQYGHTEQVIKKLQLSSAKQTICHRIWQKWWFISYNFKEKCMYKNYKDAFENLCSCGTWYTENVSMVPLYIPALHDTPTMNTWPVEMINVLYQSQSQRICVILQLQTSPAGILETAEQTTNPTTTNEKSLWVKKHLVLATFFSTIW